MSVHALDALIENVTKMGWTIPLYTKYEDKTLRQHQNFKTFLFSYTMQWKLLEFIKEWV